MCADLFQYLIKTGGPEQKTIIFCVRDLHAELLVAVEMNNLYARWCAVNGKKNENILMFSKTLSNRLNI
jgi:type I restriction enzyme R subunit